jgi:hypothetical protein
MHDDSATSTIRRPPARLCGLFAAAFLLASASTFEAQTRFVTVAWDANRESNLAGYILSYGTKSREYVTHIDVGNVTSWQLNVMPGRPYYFAVRAYNTNGYPSDYSNEIQFGGHPPSLVTPSTQTSRAGRALALQLTASDLDGDTITYGASGLPPGVTINSVTGLISGTPGTNGIGTYTVIATAADGDGSSAQTFTWVVTASPGDQDGDRKADFNIDGHPDLVWQNDTTRQAAVWHMTGAQGNVFMSVNYLGDLGAAGVPGWRVMAAGDFDADGHPDLVLQSDIMRQVLVWYVGGAEGNVLRGGNWLGDLGATGVPGWVVVGTGDFNNDGHPDVLWQNDTTRQVTIWYMGGIQGNVFLSWNWLGDLGAVGVPGWVVAGTGDFNNDGHPDVLWQNDTTRQVTIWYMGGPQGNVFQGAAWVSVAGVPGWKVILR